MSTEINVTVDRGGLLKRNRQQTTANRQAALDQDAEDRARENGERQRDALLAQAQAAAQNASRQPLRREQVGAYRNNAVTPYVGMGWLLQKVAYHITEYVAAGAIDFTVVSGDCTSSVTFRVTNHYDPTAATPQRRFRAYVHKYAVLPVRRDLFIVWINSTADYPEYEDILPAQNHLVLVSQQGARLINKPSGLAFPELTLWHKSWGFAFYDEGTPFNWANTRMKSPSLYYPSCGLDEGLRQGESFGFNELQHFSNLTATYDFAFDVLPGTGYVYSQMLNEPQGNPQATVDSPWYYGMWTPPIRLSPNALTSVWGLPAECGEPDVVAFSNNSGTFDMAFYPNGAYGYATSPAGNKRYVFEQWTGDASWKLTPFNSIANSGYRFSSADMANSNWKYGYARPINTALGDIAKPWGVTVFNEGFTDFLFPCLNARFWPILSNPWGRSWTSQLETLGFNTSTFNFEEP